MDYEGLIAFLFSKNSNHELEVSFLYVWEQLIQLVLYTLGYEPSPTGPLRKAATQDVRTLGASVGTSVL